MTEESSKQKTEGSISWPEPRWLEPHESPFGIRVYDCRKLTLVGTLWTSGKEQAEEWIRWRNGDGEEFAGAAIPDALHLPCELLYPTPFERREGRYNRPMTMEEIWCVDFYGGCFHFVHALDHRLAYRAYARPDGPEGLALTMIEAHPREASCGADHVLNAVDYLMKSHLFHWVAPHPFPPHFHDASASELSGFSFFEYGRRALFGTFETTRTLGGFPWDPERVVNHGLATRGS
jgi:hypothetical protein